MFGKNSRLALLFLVALIGCTRNGLYVQEERVDRNFLASTHVGTPDPRQLDPPSGQRLLIAWEFPHVSGVTLVATVRFWNEKEEVVRYPIWSRYGTTALFFPNQEILTYRVDAVMADGEVISSWEHPFWTRFIDYKS